jgi:outer membrane protein assembly factor BamB
MIKKILILLISLAVVHGVSATDDVQNIIKASGVKGGVVVYVSEVDPEQIASLHLNDSYLIQALDTDAGRVASARESLQAKGLYGKVSVSVWNGRTLPYIDNIVNLLVVQGSSTMAQDPEILRVLAPGGVAYVDGRKIVKPRPAELDKWGHPLYSAANNGVSKDTVVGPPHHLQWVGNPKYARNHERMTSTSVMLSAGGRLFYITDEAPSASVHIPADWQLVARDAFSGVVLWKLPISKWESHLRKNKCGPAEIGWRLAVTDRRVYVTLGYGEPLTALEPATGKILTSYNGTDGTEEIRVCDNVLYLVVSTRHTGAESEESEGKYKGNLINNTTHTENKKIMALDADSGAILWKTEETAILRTAVAVSGKRLFYHNGSALICLDVKTGKQLWRTPHESKVSNFGGSAPTLIAYGDMVYLGNSFPKPAITKDKSKKESNKNKSGKKWAGWLIGSGPIGDMNAFSAKDGTKLWSCPYADGYAAPGDIFVAQGLVWVGETPSRTYADYTKGRDPRTGSVVRTIDTSKAYDTTMTHHRCHRDRATEKYILGGMTGVEFIDLKTGEGKRHHWTRGGCSYGVIPANGLLYTPAHSCACFIESKLVGFMAMAPKRKQLAESDERLFKGPAYKKAIRVQTSGNETLSSEDWPTFRHDNMRSGFTTTEIPDDLGCLWQEKLDGSLSSPVVAQGRLFVTEIDKHTLHAFDMRSGRSVWKFIAGGRIDSPPVISDGYAVFGAADGHVYCLRADSGLLVWRFRAAPNNRQLTAYNQLESIWPVNGNVLVYKNSVYFAAGRSSYLDGGIYLYRLNLSSGELLKERNLYSRDPETGEQPVEVESFAMPGFLPDIFSMSNDTIYMRHSAFSPDNLEDKERAPHLFSAAGYLDDDLYHRSYSIYGSYNHSGYIGWFFAGRETPAGKLMVMDKESLYAYGYTGKSYYHTRKQYQLVSFAKNANPPQPKAALTTNERDYKDISKKPYHVNTSWTQPSSIFVRGMVLTENRLFIAGPSEEALELREMFDGSKGGLLCVVDKKKGETLKQFKLNTIPRHDGMIAAHGKIYMTTIDGRILCLGKGSGTAHQKVCVPLK